MHSQQCLVQLAGATTHAICHDVQVLGMLVLCPLVAAWLLGCWSE